MAVPGVVSETTHAPGRFAGALYTPGKRFITRYFVECAGRPGRVRSAPSGGPDHHVQVFGRSAGLPYMGNCDAGSRLRAGGGGQRQHRGDCRDATGAVVPGVTVTVRNTDLGITGYENNEFGVPRINANGSQMHTNYQLDGNTNTEKDRAGLRMPPVSEVLVREVKVITNGFRAAEPVSGDLRRHHRRRRHPGRSAAVSVPSAKRSTTRLGLGSWDLGFDMTASERELDTQLHLPPLPTPSFQGAGSYRLVAHLGFDLALGDWAFFGIWSLGFGS